ncbi:MAG: hypothetical protein HQK96_17465 [Nitrospirae bacterium]|nr:hypothetical protein [Nitrospirota bacterium]
MLTAKIVSMCLFIWSLIFCSDYASASDIALNGVMSCNNCTYENKDNILSIHYKGDIEASDNFRKLQALGYVTANSGSYDAVMKIHFNPVAKKDELLFHITVNSLQIDKNTSRYLSFALIMQNDMELSTEQISDSQIEQIIGGNKELSFKLSTKGFGADTLVMRFFGITICKS